jgi:hypothetical protein
VDNLLDLEGHGLARPHVGDLAEPAIWIHVNGNASLYGIVGTHP